MEPVKLTSVKIDVEMKLKEIICLHHTDVVYLTSSTTNITVQISYMASMQTT